MSESNDTYNQSIEELEFISQRIAALAHKLRENPNDVTDYKNALEVVALLLTKVIQQLSED